MNRKFMNRNYIDAMLLNCAVWIKYFITYIGKCE